MSIWLWIFAWWRHQMETFSALLAMCAGNSPVTGEFPTKRAVTRSFDVFFNLRLNKRLSNQSRLVIWDAILPILTSSQWNMDKLSHQLVCENVLFIHVLNDINVSWCLLVNKAVLTEISNVMARSSIAIWVVHLSISIYFILPSSQFKHGEFWPSRICGVPLQRASIADLVCLFGQAVSCRANIILLNVIPNAHEYPATVYPKTATKCLKISISVWQKNLQIFLYSCFVEGDSLYFMAYYFALDISRSIWPWFKEL